MEIIDELEPTKRGPYAGVVGYVDFSGNLDTAIAIRTMVWRDGQRERAGGRRRSWPTPTPADEDLECRNKARGVAHCGGRGRSASRRSARSATGSEVP